MEHCRSPDGITSILVRPYYTMLSRIYLALARPSCLYLDPNDAELMKDLLSYTDEWRDERTTTSERPYEAGYRQMCSQMAFSVSRRQHLFTGGVRSIVVSVYVFLFVSLTARIATYKTTAKLYQFCVPVAVSVARYSSDGFVMCYVLSVLWMSSYFHIMALVVRHMYF